MEIRIGHLVNACRAAIIALRSGPTAQKDYSYELGLLNTAILNATTPIRHTKKDQ